MDLENELPVCDVLANVLGETGGQCDTRVSWWLNLGSRPICGPSSKSLGDRSILEEREKGVLFPVTGAV